MHLKFKLGARGKRWLAKLHHLAIQLMISAADGTGPAITATKRSTLHPPHAARHP